MPAEIAGKDSTAVKADQLFFARTVDQRFETILG
jgi:hypothetical protein